MKGRGALIYSAEIDDAYCHMEGRWGLGGDSSPRLAFSGTSPSILQCIDQQNARHRGTGPSFELGKVHIPSEREATFPKIKKNALLHSKRISSSIWLVHGGHLLLEVFLLQILLLVISC